TLSFKSASNFVALGQHRSAQRRPPQTVPGVEAVLRARLREISVEHPRWGWREAHTIAAREGLVVKRLADDERIRDQEARRQPGVPTRRLTLPGSAAACARGLWPCEHGLGGRVGRW